MRVIKSEMSLPCIGPGKSPFVIFPLNPILGGVAFPLADFELDNKETTISPSCPVVPLCT